MNNLIKSLFTTVVMTVCTVWSVVADEKVLFELNTPMIVSEGEPFRAEFALNAKPDDKSFAPPTFDGFDVLAGPATSQGSSISIVNGKMTKSVNYSITYVLMPTRSGELRIGEAEVAVDGVKYRTRVTPVEVRAAGANASGGGSQARESRQQQSGESLEQRAGNQIGKDDVMLRLALSRRSVYKGEPIRATLKLYSRVNVAGSEGAKMPAFNGFWSQQLDIEQGPFRETLDGKVYEAYNIAEYLLYPQQSGRLTIEPSELTVFVQVVVQNPRNYDPFFGGGREIYNVRRALRTPEVAVEVKEFPAGAPASFTGAVGRYTMEATLSTDSVSANSAANINVRIAGSGNLKFMQSPTLVLPSSFEMYDVKPTEQIRNSSSGSTGYRSFEYPFIPRAEGDYTIAPIEFSYFNPETAKYVTLRSEEFTLAVLPDAKAGGAPSQVIASGVRKEDVRLLGNDIRFIKLGRPALRSNAAPLILSPLYWGIVVAMVALAVLCFVVLRKRMRDSRNTVLVHARRANKVAVQRFRKAAQYMKEQNRRAFYEEMLRALWGYISDRFNIPVADLTKESVREELSRRGAVDEAREITDIISMCEEAQYSPVATTTMDEVYGKGIEVVSKIESVVKK